MHIPHLLISKEPLMQLVSSSILLFPASFDLLNIIEGKSTVLTPLSTCLGLCVSLGTTLLLCWVGDHKESSAGELMNALRRFSIDVEDVHNYQQVNIFISILHTRSFIQNASPPAVQWSPEILTDSTSNPAAVLLTE